ncbi:diguanylate cyclase [Ramlibacter sp. 2FC]|uniref:diguanylate cyclase n=1 Tax=Ramlibacter sp. 2FC TaxID=2502188 RepID=UPI0010F89D6A|nr:diguanylate cyclase [Ramlibacter sp. 2FC]
MNPLTAFADAPPASANEAHRLDTLRRYGLLDTPPEPAFDDLALLAAQVCAAPVAMLSLVDVGRQWNKAMHGWAEREVARAVSFCARAIEQPGRLLEVLDATRDARFAQHPWVQGAEGLRFYAGAPLVVSSGHALGVLCVFDRQVRALSNAQRQALAALARQAVAQFELRQLTWLGERLGAVDPLTQVWNRRAFERRLAEEWQRHARRNESLAMLLVAVRGALAQPAAQQGRSPDEASAAQAQAAALIVEALRCSDLVASYGGELFAAILPSNGVSSAMTAAQRVRLALEHHPWAGRSMTASIGLSAMVPGRDQDPRQLTERADHALQTAIRRGGSRVEAFSGW